MEFTIPDSQFKALLISSWRASHDMQTRPRYVSHEPERAQTSLAHSSSTTQYGSAVSAFPNHIPDTIKKLGNFSLDAKYL